MARAFWKRIREAGFIDSPTSIYYSFLLRQKHASILRYISAVCLDPVTISGHDRPPGGEF